MAEYTVTTPAQRQAEAKLTANIQTIGELERVWEAMFGNTPSLLEVSKVVNKIEVEA